MVRHAQVAARWRQRQARNLTAPAGVTKACELFTHRQPRAWPWHYWAPPP